MTTSIRSIHATVKRLGAVLVPNGDVTEEAGVLNPGSAHTKDGQLLLYPRCVAKGNQSRIGIVHINNKDEKNIQCERLGFALEPTMDYEFGGELGNGCEDARVTYIPVLDKYMMTYTAYGKLGAKIALAYSEDAYKWHRLGLVNFPDHATLSGGDKDGAFFSEPVISPAGVESIAFYHRPMPFGPEPKVADVFAAPCEERDSIYIAYVPLKAAIVDVKNLLNVAESKKIMSPSPTDFWGVLKIGGGPPPVLIEEGWLSIFHGVDAVMQGDKYKKIYKAGILIHDAKQPHKIIYRSPEPILVPETQEELSGTVNNVVFPTALDARPDLGKRVFDLYYGMADYKIGLARLELS